jgi:hypothetical protein
MFGWFKNKEEYKVPELKEVRFGGHRYTPANDITSYEVSLLLPMFLSPFAQIDYQSYVDKNKLHRHFTKIIKEENNAG